MISKRVVLKFPHRLVNQPIVYRLVKDHNIEFSILKAYITPREEGLLVLELRGEDDNLKKGMEYLNHIGFKIQSLSQDVVRNEEKCTHCGACVTICPTDAFVMDTVTHKVIFHNDRCIACELCVKACPPRAMELHF